MRSRLLLTIAVVLGTAGLSDAQHQGHTQPPPSDGAGVTADSSRTADLLRISDAIVRSIEKAAAGPDARLLGDSVAGYISTVEAITSSLDLDGAQPSAAELGRAERTLGRQGERLRAAGAKSAEFQEPLDAAYDAGQRARDAIGAAREEARARDRARGSTEGVGHHGTPSAGRGCGHH